MRMRARAHSTRRKKGLFIINRHDDNDHAMESYVKSCPNLRLARAACLHAGMEWNSLIRSFVRSFAFLYLGLIVFLFPLRGSVGMGCS